MKCPVVEKEHLKTGGSSGGELSEEEWEALSSENGQFQKETLTRQRLHGAVPGRERLSKRYGAGKRGCTPQAVIRRRRMGSRPQHLLAYVHRHQR